MAFRLLHFADLHLDRSFAADRLSGSGARRRRDDLRAALLRIIDRAGQANCDLITCGGDLFDQRHITRETTSFIAEALAGAGRPVLIAPGDSDPPVPSSPYRYLRWPQGVMIAAHEELRPYRFGGINIWSASFARPDLAAAPLGARTRIGDGPNLLLLHASDMSRLPDGTTPYAPLVPSQVQEMGFSHALLGHYHQGQSSTLITYPGSPEPLGWSSPGPHCVAMVTLADDGSVSVGLEPISQRQFAEETIDISGMTGREQIREALLALQESRRLEGAVLRATLVGERSHSLELDPQALAMECSDGFAYLEFLDRSRLSHDLKAVAQEFTSRGELVRQLAGPRNPEDTPEAVGRAIQLALDAFER